ncbi:FAD-dependent oxidoreductase [Actinomycetospora sp. NBRC 106375]|uniref:FAD-dependent monooxygenase n=1 Tax=Actinomycetospora sp. NBRC 106375 TaxID=3032207 RepID=UPI0024A3C449|nr:FAD-dependent monooxygenase [Actinomycetospora sp. NBRC 106375]GLZ45140.1 FAD-dependent oxidoreductase [Actinomycetospora sp. NBRC 106375]
MIQNALVVGGGAAGAATAILLARAGVAVDLVEATPEIGSSGSGITLQGNALRVFRDLGVLDDVLAHGYAFDEVGLRTPDGGVLAVIPDARTGGPDLPATVGMPRGEMARLLAERAAEVGVKVRTGVRAESVGESGEVVCSDGTRAIHDLVVGADGLNSGVRAQLGIDTRPEPIGMGIWRVFTTRPPSVTRTDLTYGGAAHIAGYCPTGDDSLYAYLVEDAADRTGLSPDERLATMRELAAHYGGPWTEIRERMTDPSRVNYTWFTHHLVDGPWHRGRVVLAGDAAHSCPPTLAQGAAMALEDASVLVEELQAGDDLDAALTAYTARRRDRAAAVVAGSVQLARWLLDHEPPPQAGGTADVPGLMARTAALLAQRP